MQNVVVNDLIRSGQRMLSANLNDANFPTAPAYTTGEPTGARVMVLGQNGVDIPPRLKIIPFGLGSNNDAFSLRFWGYTRIGSGPAPNTAWVPHLIAEITCVMGQSVGVALSPVLATEAFCDTLAIVTQPKYIDADSGGAASRGNVEILSPVNDLIGYILLPVLGCERLYVQMDQTTGTPTANAVVQGCQW